MNNFCNYVRKPFINCKIMKGNKNKKMKRKGLHETYPVIYIKNITKQQSNTTNVLVQVFVTLTNKCCPGMGVRDGELGVGGEQESQDRQYMRAQMR